VKAYFILAALGIAVLIAGLMLARDNERKQASCTAPCVVHFKGQMAEDNFKIDYRGDGTLRVWKAQS
jgi:hypothetical protein